MAKVYVLLEINEDMESTGLKIVSASTNRRATFSRATELFVRANKDEHSYEIFIFDNDAAKLIDRVKIETNYSSIKAKPRIVSLGVRSSCIKFSS